jgi:putative SOS response-associated peptidase YedK
MCGRFTYKLTWLEIVKLYRLTLDIPARNTQTRYNVCPTDPIDVVLSQEGGRTCIPMRWGLIPMWWNKPLKEMKLATFNARAETVTTKPIFRAAFKRNRCLIPASGYYEWQDTPGGKQPFYFSRRDGAPVTIAGLWDQWRDRSTDDRITSCTMIITEPNAFVAGMHDRMPVILEENDFGPWLSGEAGSEMLKPAANDILKCWPVSKRVNSSRADAEDPTLIDPTEL